MGPGVPSLAVFFAGPCVPSLAVFLRGSWGPVPGCFSFFASMWHVFHQIFCSLLGVSSSLPVADSSLSALPPSLTAIGSLFRAPSTRCRLLLLHCCEPLGTDTNGWLRRAAPRHGPHDSSHPPWHSTASRRRFTRALVRDVSRHTTLFRGLSTQLRHQPSSAASPELSTACASSLPTLHCATVERCTLFHVLPHLQVLCVVCSPLSSLSRSAGPPARLSELTLLNPHLYVLLSSLLQADSPQHDLLRAYCWDFMSPALS